MYRPTPRAGTTAPPAGWHTHPELEGLAGQADRLYKDDLRPNDPGWRLHRDFYSNIRRFLSPGAVLCISEVEPEKTVVFLPHDDPDPWDIRPRPALEDFIGMIQDGGLRYVDTELFFTGRDGAELSIMTSLLPDPSRP